MNKESAERILTEISNLSQQLQNQLEDSSESNIEDSGMKIGTLLIKDVSIKLLIDLKKHKQ